MPFLSPNELCQSTEGKRTQWPIDCKSSPYHYATHGNRENTGLFKQKSIMCACECKYKMAAEKYIMKQLF